MSLVAVHYLLQAPELSSAAEPKLGDQVVESDNHSLICRQPREPELTFFVAAYRGGTSAFPRNPYLRRRDTLAPEAFPSGLQAWFPGFVDEEMRPEMVATWVDRTSHAVLEHMPELKEHPGLVELLRGAVREHWVAFLYAFPDSDFRFHLVDSGVLFARSLAADRFPLESLIRAYRHAQREVWAYATEVVNSVSPEEFDQAAVLIYLWERASSWIDRSIDASVEVFQEELDRLMQRASAQRYEAVMRFLRSSVEDTSHVTTYLSDYSLAGSHTAVIIETTDPESVADLEQIVNEIANVIDPTANRLVVYPGGQQMWGWIGSREAPDLDSLTAHRSRLRDLDARLYVGIPADGPLGFASSHRDAQRLSQTAAEAGVWDSVMRFDEVEIVALLGCTPEVDRFVSRTLGPLEAPDDAAARLRETVASFLLSGLNVGEAAARLHVHPNTVRYRLRRAEEILTRPISTTGDHLLLAIQHADLYHRRSGPDIEVTNRPNARSHSA